MATTLAHFDLMLSVFLYVWGDMAVVLGLALAKFLHRGRVKRTLDGWTEQPISANVWPGYHRWTQLTEGLTG